MPPPGRYARYGCWTDTELDRFAWVGPPPRGFARCAGRPR